MAIPYSQSGREPSYVLIYVSSCARTLSMSSAAGLVCPAHASAIGKCILAYMSASELQTYQGLPLTRFTDKTICDWHKLSPELEQVRNQGFAVSSGEYEFELSDIAVPVFDSMHYAIGAICVSGPSERILQLDLTYLVRQMKNASAVMAAGM